MTRYAAVRLLLFIPVLLGASVVVFAVVHLIPGDPAQLLAGPDATAETVKALRDELELDQPLVIQYGGFLVRAVKGDLGRSIRTRRPVLRELASRIPATVQLACASMAISVLVGSALGLFSALRHNRAGDVVAMSAAMVGVSTPVFWLGLMLIYAFAVWLPIFPTGGRGSVQHLVLPAVTLAAGSTAVLARMTRSAMLEVLREDYVRTARAKGLGPVLVVGRHALTNALIPVITIVGLQFGAVLGGAVITESVFAWPGLGRLLVDAVTYRDYPVVQGAVLLLTIMFSTLNLLMDLLYAYLNPQIRYR